MTTSREPTGTRFLDNTFGEMILADAANGEWSGWLWYKLPGGRMWSTYRLPTAPERDKIADTAAARGVADLNHEAATAAVHLEATQVAGAKLIGLVDLLMQSVSPLVDRDSFGQAFDPVQVQGCMNAIEAHYADMRRNPHIMLKPRS